MRFFGDDATNRNFEMLKTVPVFRALDRREIRVVEELLHERRYEKDEIIFEEGDAGHGVYIIVSGKVGLKSSHKLLETAIFEFGPGDTVGELSLFDEAPQIATAFALEPTVTVALFQAELSSLLTHNTRIGVKVLLELSRALSRRARRLLLQESGLPSV